MVTAVACDASQRMDAFYARQRHIYDLTRRAYLVGREKLLLELEPPKEGKILEIACGTARNLIKAARLYPTTQLVGVDVSSLMLETASRRVRRSGLDNRIRLFFADAIALDAEGRCRFDKYDRVIISYALSMIPTWKVVLRSAYSLLASHGSLHIVDFGRQESFPACAKKLALALLRRYLTTPPEELEQEAFRLSQETSSTCRFESLLAGYAQYVVVHRDWP